ncbi:hypothetical protein [Streptomyces sp. NPDC085466]|uniref:hypothetical protein n=1 Tax=Streptomyces sp. NPDC085466 TaxID=3365725 RepID=UPI0037CDC466
MIIARGRGGFIALAVMATLAVAGCGADTEPNASQKPTASAQPSQQPTSTQDELPREEPSEPLLVAKGQKGLEIEVTEAERDAGGFLTIKGRLKNTSDGVSAIPAQTSGNETEVVKHGQSLGGATLVDSLGKKRYYVLRDTDGRPLTTAGFSTLGPGKSTAVFMQFPAPPASTTEVSFQLPTFEPATLKLS